MIRQNFGNGWNGNFPQALPSSMAMNGRAGIL
jgi:hypothetical protein